MRLCDSSPLRSARRPLNGTAYSSSGVSLQSHPTRSVSSSVLSESVSPLRVLFVKGHAVQRHLRSFSPQRFLKGDAMNEVRYEPHVLSLRLPDQTPDERQALKSNMVGRVQRGLLPLEFPILLVDGKIADGRHRYAIWLELAQEGACDGYFAKHSPPVEEVKADAGESRAVLLLRLHSRNLCHRSLSADQRVSQLLLDIVEVPELKELVEQIEAENEARMKAGKAQSTDSQGSTNRQIGKMVGASPATVKKGKAVQKHAPERLAEVATGKKSANKVLKEIKETKKKDSAPKPKAEVSEPQPLLDAKVGESILTVLPYFMGQGDVKIQERIVKEVHENEYRFEDGITLQKDSAFVAKEAQKARTLQLHRAIQMLEDEQAKVRAALKKEGAILAPIKRGRGRPPKTS